MKILVTGAAGYIGSFMCLKLLEEKHNVVAVDNLSTGSIKAIYLVQKLANRKMNFYHADAGNYSHMIQIIKNEMPDAVIHFAGYKNTRESLSVPGAYYQNNLGNTLTLLSAMQTAGCMNIIFSSSCTVYGDSKEMPITEESKTGPITPYGHSKLFVEQALKDICVSSDWSAISLRYFNPAGAHESGILGEHQKHPTGLFPVIGECIKGNRESVLIYGDDFDTRDGSPVRDYLHIDDLIEAHMLALIKVTQTSGYDYYNVGSGMGYSVLEVIETFQEITGEEIPFEIEKRRDGDVAKAYASYDKISSDLMWSPQKNLIDMCRDFYSWLRVTPNGYRDNEKSYIDHITSD